MVIFMKTIRLEYSSLDASPPKRFVERLQNELKNINLYPDGYQELKRNIAKHIDVTEKEIFLGNGTDDIINVITRLYGKRVLIPTPTFGRFQIEAKLNGSKIKLAECISGKDYNLRFSNIDKEWASLVWICNPNNPTGTLISKENIIEIIDKSTGLIVVDESYFEYSGETILDYSRNMTNVIVLRGFSKGWGIAGLRLGFAVAHPKIIETLEKHMVPFNINRIAVAAGLQVFDFYNYYSRYVKKTRKIRDWFRKELLEMGLDVFDSSANFVLVGFRNKSKSLDAMKFLMKHDIYLLHINHEEFTDTQADRFLRFCIKNKDDMKYVVEKLWKFLKKG